MEIMKKVKRSLLWFLTLTFFFVCCGEVQADTTWQIKCNEDSTIVETVITDNRELSDILTSNDFAPGPEEGYYSRKLEDWQTFNKLDRKFPIMADTKNFLIFSLTTIYIDNNSDTNILRDWDEPIKFRYSAWGFNIKNTGQKVADSTTEWILTPGRADSFPQPYLTKTIFFNGFILAVFITLVGLICIGMFFLKTIKRVNNLIEEEYSIENYLAKQEKRNQDEN